MTLLRVPEKNQGGQRSVPVTNPSEKALLKWIVVELRLVTYLLQHGLNTKDDLTIIRNDILDEVHSELDF